MQTYYLDAALSKGTITNENNAVSLYLKCHAIVALIMSYKAMPRDIAY